MIVGIGSDLCDMRRVERMVARFGARFLERVYTATERAHAERRTGDARIGTYAKRWAAKEACAKALGTGFSQGVFLQDIRVRNKPGGAPTVELAGGALAALQRLLPPGRSADIQLSMTDETPYALAHVIIQILPSDG
ncbi:holo-ACP synthase [Neoasaia chiangmaiensis NBRC 101099]|uniref:Holo-[acyl-carrier-protein] synthase n=1 Tax=Neoasaia chiangmaiensis TaxID=320497 RepID=A0A1U9KRH3_9PROT|nr:holo-ACP synthase [Neoasaia chiangmaiensis]AQS88347.1 holo-ACP synthase [Neoasaia chiangmaiensis]GBR39477.1 holo-ACP synthase [Neoasaia chiangmaiensis NBRC 101099]GEN14599.1 holo-[acyl-carrier-protein] synthase [Neoasaia chiangmaiensis]